MNTRDKAIELIKENFTDRDLMVELKGSDLVYQAVLKTVQQALNIDLVSFSLPTDDEIENQADSALFGFGKGRQYDDDYHTGYIDGAKWIKKESNES
jgi:hypothetical protein